MVLNKRFVQIKKVSAVLHGKCYSRSYYLRQHVFTFYIHLSPVSCIMLFGQNLSNFGLWTAFEKLCLEISTKVREHNI